MGPKEQPFKKVTIHKLMRCSLSIS